MKLLADESRLVRTSAARALLNSAAVTTLSPNETDQLEEALQEVHTELMAAADRGGTHMSWAMICEQLGQIRQSQGDYEQAFAAYREAIESYQTAIRVEPNTTGPRSNLANLLEQLAPRLPPEQRDAMLERAKTLKQEELPLLARDARLAPNLGAIQYRYGLALYLDGQLEKALEQLEKAAELEPDNPDFQTAVRLLKEKMDEAQ
jgi:tetratricopeptide (TPR) repeat protein